MSIRSFIVDDEVHNIENLTCLLQAHCPEVEVAGSAGSVKEALTGIQACKPDVLFLDIRLNHETGFDLLQQIDHEKTAVIFITAYDQYGIQAIKYAALDYLLKPVDSAELISAVQRAVHALQYKTQNEQLHFLLQEMASGKTKRIALPAQQEIRYVAVSSIVRCEASNNYTFIFLENGEKILVAKTLKAYADILPTTDFLRTHQSHLVNISFIRSWLKEDGGMLLLTNGSAIPVSRINRERIRTILEQ